MRSDERAVERERQVDEDVEKGDPHDNRREDQRDRGELIEEPCARPSPNREPGAQARERHDESRGQTFSVSRNAAVKSRALSGFLAGVVRKKLGLTLQSEKTDGERVYRVIEPQPA
jgi:hypothetical protein